MCDIGDRFCNLTVDQSKWSQETFGTDTERGPMGALKHLEKEAREAQASPSDPSEYADCFLLILDAARRAGITPIELIEHAQAKMEINKKRVWPKPTSDEPVEHVRDEKQVYSRSIPTSAVTRSECASFCAPTWNVLSITAPEAVVELAQQIRIIRQTVDKAIQEAERRAQRLASNVPHDVETDSRWKKYDEAEGGLVALRTLRSSLAF